VIDDFENRAAVAKAHLGLHRMDVDVNVFGAHVDEQQRRRMAPARDQRLVSLFDCANQHPVANGAAVDEGEDHSAGREGFLAGGGQALRAKAATGEVEGEHLRGDLRTEELAESFERRVGARQIEKCAAVGGKTERDVMIGERDALE